MNQQRNSNSQHTAKLFATVSQWTMACGRAARLLLSLRVPRSAAWSASNPAAAYLSTNAPFFRRCCYDISDFVSHKARWLLATLWSSPLMLQTISGPLFSAIMGLFVSGKSITLLSLPSLMGIAVFAYVVHSIVQHIHLRQFKGPPTAGFSKLWLLKVMRSGKMHLAFTETNKKYGTPIIFFGSFLMFEDIRIPYQCSCLFNIQLLTFSW